MNDKTFALFTSLSELIYWTKASAVAEVRGVDSIADRKLETATKEFCEILAELVDKKEE